MFKKNNTYTYTLQVHGKHKYNMTTHRYILLKIIYIICNGRMSQRAKHVFQFDVYNAFSMHYKGQLKVECRLTRCNQNTTTISSYVNKDNAIVYIPNNGKKISGLNEN